jgi:hypothetical protein
MWARAVELGRAARPICIPSGIARAFQRKSEHRQLFETTFTFTPVAGSNKLNLFSPIENQTFTSPAVCPIHAQHSKLEKATVLTCA